MQPMDQLKSKADLYLVWCDGNANKVEMTLQERLLHYAKCRNPKCVARRAGYEQIAAYVRDHINDGK